MSEAYAHVPGWLEIVGWISLGLAVISSLIIIWDIFIRGYRQKMAIMGAVYPLTCLYFGPLALWFYFIHGRGEEESGDSRKIYWFDISKAVSHCGAGCTLGDIIGEWLVFAFGFTVASHSLFADYFFDFGLAWALGIIFQYLTIAQMSQAGNSPLMHIWRAIKIDTLSIIVFQVGLFAGMYIYQNLLFSRPLAKTTSAYWFLMQLSMMLGFFTAYPLNYWLVRIGLKEKM